MIVFNTKHVYFIEYQNTQGEELSLCCVKTIILKGLILKETLVL